MLIEITIRIEGLNIRIQIVRISKVNDGSP